MASTTSAYWPIALHMRIFASGSSFTIARTASMPPMSGITMSIVTRSGLSCRYFSTACVPVSASPTTANPACPRMSLIIVRMKMASSQTRTVWLTARSLGSQNRAQQRRDIEYDEQVSVPPAHRADQRGIDARQIAPFLQRGVARGQHIEYFVNRKAEQPVRTLFGPPPALRAFPVPPHFEDKRRARGDLESGAGSACGGGGSGGGGGGRKTQGTPPFHDRHQCAADIHQPRHDRGRARNTRRWEPRENLPHLVHLGRACQCAHAEHEQASGDEASVSHRMRRSQDTARGCAEQANLRPLPLPLARDASQQAIRTSRRSAHWSPDERTTGPPRAAAGAARALRDARLPSAPRASPAGCRRTCTRGPRRSGNPRAPGARGFDGSGRCRGERGGDRYARSGPRRPHASRRAGHPAPRSCACALWGGARSALRCRPLFCAGAPTRSPHIRA